MDLAQFTQTVLRNRGTVEDAKEQLVQHGYTKVLLACTQQVFDSLTTPAIQSFILSKSSDPKVVQDTVMALTARLLPLFKAYERVVLTPAEREPLRRQALLAQEQAAGVYAGLPLPNLYGVVSAQLCLLARQANLPLTIDDQPSALAATASLPVKREGLMHVLLRFAPLYMTCDARWGLLLTTAELAGCTLFDMGLQQELRKQLGSHASVQPLQFQHSAVRRYPTQTPGCSEIAHYRLNVTSDQLSIGYDAAAKDPFLPSDDPAVANGLRQDGQYTFGRLLRPWVEPWTWPGLAEASPQTKASLLAWCLTDYDNPQHAQWMADALNIPWDVVNDKTPAQWAAQDPQITIATFTPIFTPAGPAQTLPDLSF